MGAFVFSDVHGDSLAIRRAITRAREIAGPDVELLSVGDLVDRGPDTQGVLDICVGEGVVGVCGNHEGWLCELLSSGNFTEMALHPKMGGANTFLSYGLDPQRFDTQTLAYALCQRLPETHKDWLLGLPLTRSLSVGGTTYRITHGGIPTSLGKFVCGFFEKELQKHGLPLTSEEVSKAAFRFIAEKHSEAFVWGGARRGTCFKFPDESVQIFGHNPWQGGAEINPQGGYIALGSGSRFVSGVLLQEDGSRQILTSL